MGRADREREIARLERELTQARRSSGDASAEVERLEATIEALEEDSREQTARGE